MTLLALRSLLGYAFMAWQLASLCRLWGVRGGLLNTIRAELHPFRWALCIGWYVLLCATSGPVVSWGAHVAFAFALWTCWSARHDNDDDDRWQRRIDAATGYVREVGGRLVVVPETA